MTKACRDAGAAHPGIRLLVLDGARNACVKQRQLPPRESAGHPCRYHAYSSSMIVKHASQRLMCLALLCMCKQSWVPAGSPMRAVV